MIGAVLVLGACSSGGHLTPTTASIPQPINTVWAATAHELLACHGPNRCTRIAVPGVGAISALAVSPPGEPNAGDVFVAGDPSPAGDDTSPGVVKILSPAGRVLRTVETGPGPGDVEIAPAGVTGAGTAYVLDQGQNAERGPQVAELTVVTASGRTRTVDVGETPQGLVFAPPGTPAAGTAYVATANGRAGRVVAISPAGTQRVLQTDSGGDAIGMIAVTPAGAPAPGTVYAYDDRHLASYHPDGSPGATVPVSLPADLAVAGAGTPLPGELYIFSYDPKTRGLYLMDGRSLRKVEHPATVYDFMGVAPQGQPNAGSLYTFDASGDALLVSPAGVVQRTALHEQSVWMAPDGTLYSLGPDLALLSPTGTRTVLARGAFDEVATFMPDR
jgi:hypothetical protein